MECKAYKARICPILNRICLFCTYCIVWTCGNAGRESDVLSDCAKYSGILYAAAPEQSRLLSIWIRHGRIISSMITERIERFFWCFVMHQWPWARRFFKSISVEFSESIFLQIRWNMIPDISLLNVHADLCVSLYNESGQRYLYLQHFEIFTVILVSILPLK